VTAKHFNRIQRLLGTSADCVTDMFTDRQMVSECNTKHFGGRLLGVYLAESVERCCETFFCCQWRQFQL